MNKLMSKYLTKTDLQTIDDLKSAIYEDKISVTCVGLYNHGKSTLLNALIKDFEHKTFKTADVRETYVSKVVEYNNIRFVDTPGLNAKEYDDKLVMKAIGESDINLFVHTVTTGEFTEKEIDFLNKIKKHWKNPQEFIERTIFVVSRIDKANNKQDIDKTVEKITTQILKFFDSKPIVIPVSAMRYTKGQIEKKNILIKKSNFEMLEEKITKFQEQAIEPIKRTKKDRLENYYSELLQKLSSKLEVKKLELNKLRNEKMEIDKNLNKDIDKIESTLNNINNIKNTHILELNLEDIPYAIVTEYRCCVGDKERMRTLKKVRKKLENHGMLTRNLKHLIDDCMEGI